MKKLLWFAGIIAICLICTDVIGQKQKNFPEFSWDHVPLYMHMRKSEAFTPEELKYLAGFPIITLEKTTGSKTYGSTEKGSLEAASGIKAINPDAKVLYYRNIMVHYGGYDVNNSLDKIDSPFLMDSLGNTNIVHNGKREAYDLTNPELRKWWVDDCVEMANHDQIDGIFIDGNIKALEPEFLGQVIGEEKKARVAEAYEQVMKELYQRTSKDKLLIANLIRARLPNSGLEYLNYLHGSYIEGFETEANGLSRLDYMVKGIDAIQQAARDGKINCFSLGLGRARKTGIGIDDTRMKADDVSLFQDRLTYTLALFLVCAEKYSYFLAHDGYSVNGDDSAVWLKRFPEYQKPLGRPKGPAKKEGYTYTREFKHASVWLDIEQQKANIEWK